MVFVNILKGNGRARYAQIGDQYWKAKRATKAQEKWNSNMNEKCTRLM